MKKRLFVAALLLFLTACGVPKTAEIPAPVQTPVVIAAPTPEVKKTVLSETFRPGEYIDEMTVTVTCGDGIPSVITVVQNGEPLQTFVEEGDAGRSCAMRFMTVEDMNFDGYLDFRFSFATYVGADVSEHVYLYECGSDTQGFYKAEALDAYTGLSFNAESELIYAHNRSARIGIDYILRWTREGVAPLRQLAWERDFGSERTAYKVYDKDPSAPVSEDAWTLLVQWEIVGASEPEIELTPWLDPAYYGENAKTPRYIPTDLLDYLTSLLERGEGYESIQNCGAFLDHYEVPRIAGNSFEIFKEKVWYEGWEGGMLAGVSGGMADLDNDGIEDAVLLSCQGTGHFTTLYFLRGLPDGDYEYTFDVPFNRGDWRWCISWKGTRYLVSLAGDRDESRRATGYNLYLLKDGAVRDRVFLSADQVNWHETARSAEPGYEAAADHLAAVGPEIWAEFAKTGKQHAGTAERVDAAGTYLCDWDGDGTEERYNKATGGSNATGRALYTSLEIEIMNEDGLAQMVWFDRVGEETLLIRADNFGDEPVELTALRWTGTAWQDVAHATLEPDREVTRYRWTQGENIDFKTADWAWAWAGNAYGDQLK